MKIKTTLLLLAYNQENFIREAVLGAFAQKCENLEIIISDDASSDSTYNIAEDIVRKYDGGHKVILLKNDKNIGIGAHINKLMQLASGEYIIGAAGDDISHPDRARLIVDIFESDSRVMSVWSSANYIDENSNNLERRFEGYTGVHSLKDILNDKFPVIGATHAWRKLVFDYFGNLENNVVFEDNAISFRSFLLGKIYYLDNKLVDYRVSVNSLTNYARHKNYHLLYKKAAERSSWVINGIHQRFIDINTAEKNGLLTVDTKNFMFAILNNKKNKYLLRISMYLSYPNIKFPRIINLLTDKELLKMLYRSFTRM